MDIANLMQMANQLREQLQTAQADAGRTRFNGEAGGGMVRLVLNGRHEVVELKIDPANLGPAVDAESLSLLEDLLRAAFNQASSQVASGLQNRLGAMAQGMGVDLSALNLGGLADGVSPAAQGGGAPGGGTDHEPEKGGTEGV